MTFLYIDPGTGSMLISATVALISVAFFMLKGVVYRKFGLGGDKGDIVDPLVHRDIVIYSEGKQYWNVFKGIVEGCLEEGISLSYFTSDKQDPGLLIESNNLEAKYIGSGREAYYIMNRLNANIVMMTTPGLDVLEIKRSKDVLHYVHVTHATGSIADYKTYGVDYFDSVMLGGNGDINVVRELETYRNLPSKHIEVVGHTYLDVLRDRMDEIDEEDFYFKNERKTVLVSPTWGMYSLLNNIGDELLSSLEDSDDYNIIIRPHPQSFISDKDIIEDLMSKYPDNDFRKWDIGTDNIVAMLNSDVMISDYSGIIFDYYSLMMKPIITMHGLFKKEGLDAMDLHENAWNIDILNKIGLVLKEEDVKNINYIVEDILTKTNVDSRSNELITEMSLYPGESKKRSINYLIRLLEETELERVDNRDNINNSNSNKDLEIIDSNYKISIFLNNFLITGVVFYLYLKVLVENFVPEGNTYIMLLELMRYARIMISLTVLILWLYIWIIRKGKFKLIKEKEAINFGDLPILLIPMIPIIQYIGANQDILNFRLSTSLFLYFFVITLTVVILIPYILSSFVSKNMMVSMSVSVLFTIFNMASYGTEMRYRYIVLIMMLITLFIYVLLLRDKKKILIVISLILFVSNGINPIIQILNSGNSGSTLTEKDTKFLKYIDENNVVNKPSIYLLTYDAYANEETMTKYDFDNSDHMNYLLDEGFAIYDGTYSLGHASLISMANVIQTTSTVQSYKDTREKISGKNTTMHFMDKYKYDTKLILSSNYMFSGYDPKYKDVIPGKQDLISPFEIIKGAILQGEFRNDADFSHVSYEEFIERKNDMLGSKKDNPIFVYMHDDYPGHKEKSRALKDDDREKYLNRVIKSNEEMKTNIERIKSTDKDAIIVIMGDHGPFLGKGGLKSSDYEINEVTKYDMQDLQGAFLSIMWPDSDYVDKYNIETIQDVFPAIFAYMYEDDFLFEELIIDRKSINDSIIGGVYIEEGVIVNGKDDGNILFDRNRVRYREK